MNAWNKIGLSKIVRASICDHGIDYTFCDWSIRHGENNIS